MMELSCLLGLVFPELRLRPGDGVFEAQGAAAGQEGGGDGGQILSRRVQLRSELVEAVSKGAELLAGGLSASPPLLPGTEGEFLHVVADRNTFRLRLGGDLDKQRLGEAEGYGF